MLELVDHLFSIAPCAIEEASVPRIVGLKESEVLSSFSTFQNRFYVEGKLHTDLRRELLALFARHIPRNLTESLVGEF